MKNINKSIFKRNLIRFGLIGEFQSGKSLLINCILHRSIATVGLGYATTHTIVNYRYSEFEEYVEYIDNNGSRHVLPVNGIDRIDMSTDILVVDVYLSNKILKDFILTDMPGFGANKKDDSVAQKTLLDLDFAILVASNDKAIGAESSTFSYISELRQYNIPYYFILNCRDKDKWNCNEKANINIAMDDLELLSFYPPIKYPLKDDCINIVNFMWYWYSICEKNDGLINRPEIQNALINYEDERDKMKVGEASNFELIKRLFNMENRGFLELILEIKKLKNEICPIGTIQTFAFSCVPDGWMICDGNELKTELYPELFSVIGNTFGGDGKESFKLPDLRGRFVRGNDENNNVGTVQEDTVQGHDHVMASCSENGKHYHYVGFHNVRIDEANAFYSRWTYQHICDYNGNLKAGNYNTDRDGNHKHEITIGLPASNSEYGEIRISDETRPKNVALLFCIKYK